MQMMPTAEGWTYTRWTKRYVDIDEGKIDECYWQVGRKSYLTYMASLLIP